MSQFDTTEKNDLETAIKVAINDLQLFLDNVKQASNPEQKLQLAKQAWGEYNITRRDLYTLYNAQPKDQKIEEQLVFYKNLGQQVMDLTKENLCPERKEQLKNINDAIDKRMDQNKLTSADNNTASMAPQLATIARPRDRVVRTLFPAVAQPTAAIIPPPAAVTPPPAPIVPSPLAVAPCTPAYSPVPESILSAPVAMAPASGVLVSAKVQNAQIEKVSKILDELNSKISEINKSDVYSQGTKNVATTLIKELYEVRDDLRNNMATDAFISRTRQVIYKAKPALINDLSWRDYLKNILKSLVNALTQISSLGLHKGFFELKQTAYAPLLENAEKDLITAAPAVAAWPSYISAT